MVLRRDISMPFLNKLFAASENVQGNAQRCHAILSVFNIRSSKIENGRRIHMLDDIIRQSDTEIFGGNCICSRFSSNVFDQ